MFPATESEMVQVASNELARLGRRFATEVPFLNRSIDLVYEDQQLDALVAIEFKLSHWQRGIKQARDHLLGTVWVYICLPESKISESLLDRASRESLGVLAWSRDEPLKVRLQPKCAEDYVLDTTTSWLYDAFNSRLEEGS